MPPHARIFWPSLDGGRGACRFGAWHASYFFETTPVVEFSHKTHISDVSGPVNDVTRAASYVFASKIATSSWTSMSKKQKGSGGTVVEIQRKEWALKR